MAAARHGYDPLMPINPDGPEQPYRSAGYSTEIHPEQQQQLEEQLDRLADTDPVKVALGILLGLELLTDLEYCTRCGAIVHDKAAHGFWHDYLDSRAGA